MLGDQLLKFTCRKFGIIWVCVCDINDDVIDEVVGPKMGKNHPPPKNIWRECGTNFSFIMVIEPNNRIGSAVIRTWSRDCRVFYRPYCILLTQHFLSKKGPKIGQDDFFLQNRFQIRILRPRIDLPAKFHEFWRILFFQVFWGPNSRGPVPGQLPGLQNTCSDTWPVSWVGQSYSFMVDCIPMEAQGYRPSGSWNTGGVLFAETPPLYRRPMA